MVIVKMSTPPATGPDDQTVYPMSGFVDLGSNPIDFRNIAGRGMVKGQGFIRATNAQISNSAPNLFTYREFTNTTVRIRLGADPWVTVLLDTGRYEAEDVGAAINDAIGLTPYPYGAPGELGWWADPLDPGLLIMENRALGKRQITIDSSKTKNLAQFSLDLTASQIGNTLGYAPAVQLITADGVYITRIGNSMYTQGTGVMLKCPQAPIRPSSGLNNSPTLGFVPFYRTERVNKFLFYPHDGETNPKNSYDVGRQLTRMDVELVRDDGSTPMLFAPDSSAIALVEVGTY